MTSTPSAEDPGLTVITDPRDLQEAFEALGSPLRSGAGSVSHRIGYPGGHVDGEVWWHPKHGFWSECLPVDREPNRFICSFGVQDPTTPDAPSSLSIACEINPPKAGIDRRVGGVLLEDPTGRLFVASQGKLGGAQKGVGQNAFLEWLGAPHLTTITWPDGVSARVVLLGALQSPRFLTRLAEYVRKAQEFKDAVKEKGAAALPAPTPTGFSPEFAGPKKGQKPRAVIDSQCDHGYVVNSLADLMKQRGLAVSNDTSRDLVVDAGKGRRVLFEAKTAVGTQSIYTGVGQLMLHGAVTPEPSRVLVIAQSPKGDTAKRLARLGIEVLTYDLDGTTARFPGLPALLKRLGLEE